MSSLADFEDEGSLTTIRKITALISPAGLEALPEQDEHISEGLKRVSSPANSTLNSPMLTKSFNLT